MQELTQAQGSLRSSFEENYTRTVFRINATELQHLEADEQHDVADIQMLKEDRELALSRGALAVKEIARSSKNAAR